MANGLQIRPTGGPDILGGASQGLGLREQFQGGRQREQLRGLELQRERDQARISSVVQGAQQLKLINNPQGKIDFLRNRRDQLIQAGISTEDTDEVLELAESGQFDQVEQLTDRAISFGQQSQEQFTLSPGQVRFGSRGQPIAQVRDRPKADVIQKQVNTLRSGVKDVTKSFKTVEESFKRIQSVTRKPSAAGDIALIFNFMKMLDPGSTVREGEFAVAASAAGLPERIIQAAVRVDNGERLSANQRSDFLSQSNNLFASQREATDNQLENILQQADQDEINRTRVLGKERLKDFQKRISSRPPESRAATQAAPVFSAALNREVSEQDITETLQANPGITREQLLQQLGIQ